MLEALDIVGLLAVASTSPHPFYSGRVTKDDAGRNQTECMPIESKLGIRGLSQATASGSVPEVLT